MAETDRFHRLADIGLLGIENNRTRAYLQRMLFCGIAPAEIIYLRNPNSVVLEGQRGDDIVAASNSREIQVGVNESSVFQFREDEPILATAQAADIPLQVLDTVEVNGKEVSETLQSSGPSIWIYSGPGGVILRSSLLSLGKQFLHVHPGRLPEYRGSTTVYYSILEQGSVGASAIFLSSRVDEGDFIAQRDFALPENFLDLDYIYDPLIRSELLCEVLQSYQKTGEFSTEPQRGQARLYYIIHPVLKHLCILSNRGWNHEAEEGEKPQSYSYTGHRPFEEPHKYTYSKYGGARFLAAYRQERREFLDSFAELTDSLNEIDAALVSEEHSTDPGGTEESGVVITEDFQREIIEQTRGNEYMDSARQAAESIRRRFEARRLLFERYEKNFSRGRGSCSNPFLYIQASVIFRRMLAGQSDLRYLNALLKLNDILLSLSPAELSDSWRGVIAAGVQAELEAVQEWQARL